MQWLENVGRADEYVTDVQCDGSCMAHSTQLLKHYLRVEFKHRGVFCLRISEAETTNDACLVKRSKCVTNDSNNLEIGISSIRS